MNLTENHTRMRGPRLNCTLDVNNEWCNPLILNLKNLVTILDLYLTPFIIAVGVVGNFLSFLVFSSTYLRRMSSSIYLAALALADIGYLVNLFFSWMGNFGVNIWNRNGWCHFFVYTTYVTSFLSVWYVVCFTMERYLIVCFPLKRQILCRPHRAKIVVIALAMLSLFLYNWSIWTVHVEVWYDGQPICSPRAEYLLLATAINNADTLITLVIPALVIVVSNVRIAYALSKFYKTRRAIDATLRQRMAVVSSRSSSSSSSMRAAVTAVHAGSSSSLALRCSNTSYNTIYSNSSYNRLQMKVTKMLLIVSTVFLAYNIPGHVIRVYVFIAQLVSPSDYGPSALLHLMQKLAMLIYYAGFATNFILYSISGKTFRRAFIRMWTCFGHRMSACFYDAYVTVARVRSPKEPKAEVHFRLKRREFAYN